MNRSFGVFVTPMSLCYPVKRKQANFLTPLMSGEHCRFLGILAIALSFHYLLCRKFLLL